MLLHQVNWIREHRDKMCFILKKRVLADYKPIKYVPSCLQGFIKKYRKKWHKHKVIVQFNPKSLLKGKGEMRLLSNALGLTVKRELGIIDAVASELSTEQLEQVIRQPAVAKIWCDRQVSALLDIAAPTVGASALWQPSEGEGPRFTGAGVTVAVIDSGVYRHPDLAGRIIYFKDYVKNRKKPYDDNGHGTHVAGCVAGDGRQSKGKFCGIAPGANLVALKTLDKYGFGNSSGVIEAIQWCRDNKDKYNIRIANLSLGVAPSQSYKYDPMCMAVEELWRAGVVVCAAAGNDGPMEKTINTPGIDPRIITVGASDDFNTIDIRDDEVADFSSRGPTIDGLLKPDFITPGNNIISLCAPGSLVNKKYRSSRYNKYYTTLSGTSMSTPICCGVVALMLESSPKIVPDQVKEKLIRNCHPLGSYSNNEQGAGLVDAGSTVKLVILEQ